MSYLVRHRPTKRLKAWTPRGLGSSAVCRYTGTHLGPCFEGISHDINLRESANTAAILCLGNGPNQPAPTVRERLSAISAIAGPLLEGRDMKTRSQTTRNVLPVNGGAKLVPPGGAKLVHLTLCGTRCWGVVPVVHRRDPRCFVSRLRYAERSSVGGSCGPTGSTIAPAVKQVFLGISAVFGFG